MAAGKHPAEEEKASAAGNYPATDARRQDGCSARTLPTQSHIVVTPQAAAILAAVIRAIRSGLPVVAEVKRSSPNAASCAILSRVRFAASA
jgi:hypothetical protein